MKDLVCDFSISSFDNEIEEVVMFDDNFTEEKMTSVIEEWVTDKKINIGERCEGSVFKESGTLFVEYKYCTEVGEDWDDDKWVVEKFEVTI